MRRFVGFILVLLVLTTILYGPKLLFIQESGKVGSSFIRTSQAVRLQIGEIQEVKLKLYFDEMIYRERTIRRWYECEGSMGAGTFGASLTKAEDGWMLNSVFLRQDRGWEVELPVTSGTEG